MCCVRVCSCTVLTNVQINVHYKDAGDGVFIDAAFNRSIEYVDAWWHGVALSRACSCCMCIRLRVLPAPPCPHCYGMCSPCSFPSVVDSVDQESQGIFAYVAGTAVVVLIAAFLYKQKSSSDSVSMIAGSSLLALKSIAWRWCFPHRPSLACNSKISLGPVQFHFG